MKSFSDKVAAITGAGSGIGRALALQLAGEGCHLALSDINETGLAETAERARAHGVRVTTKSLDVSDRPNVYAWADEVMAEHGRVNLIFNNAGVALASTLEGVDYADFEWIVNINFWGVVYGTKAFLPHLKASGEGHVVNISSVFGILTVPTQGAYNATKFAVRGFTEALRQELELAGSSVSATCVHPGGIRTNIARDSRVADNVARMISGDPRERFSKLFITSPEEAARVILRAVRRNKRRVLVGRDAHVIDAATRALPGATQRLTTALTRRFTR